MASLLWYLDKGEEGGFHIEDKEEDDQASIYINGLKAGFFPEPTPEGGSFHIQGIFTPHNEKIDDLDITFLEVPGEDCQKIEKGEMPNELSIYFRANVKMIFILVAPYDFTDETDNQGDFADDQGLMKKFLSYLARENASNIEKSPSILLLSQLDKYKKRRSMDSEETLVKKLLPNVYNQLINSGSVIGCYSVGETTVVNKKPAIRKINEDYPARIWREIYTLCTGQDLELPKPKEKKKSLGKRITFFFTGKKS